MRSKRLFAAGAVIATLSLAVTACCRAAEGRGQRSANQKTSLTLGWNQPFYSYNENTSNGNATANNNIKYLMNEQFWYVDANGELKADKSFGTYEKTSDDPLTVKYTSTTTRSGPTAPPSTRPTCCSTGPRRAAT